MGREQPIISTRVTPEILGGLSRLSELGINQSEFIRDALLNAFSNIDDEELKRIAAVEKKRREFKKTLWILDTSRRFLESTQRYSAIDKIIIADKLQDMLILMTDLKDNKELKPELQRATLKLKQVIRQLKKDNMPTKVDSVKWGE